MNNQSEQELSILSLIIDDNILKPHYRVAPGECACGFNAYNVRGIMLDYGDILHSHIDNEKKSSNEYQSRIDKVAQLITRHTEQKVLEAKIDEVEHIANYTNGMTNQMFDNLKNRVSELNKLKEKTNDR